MIKRHKKSKDKLKSLAIPEEYYYVYDDGYGDGYQDGRMEQAEFDAPIIKKSRNIGIILGLGLGGLLTYGFINYKNKKNNYRELGD